MAEKGPNGPSTLGRAPDEDVEMSFLVWAVTGHEASDKSLASPSLFLQCVGIIAFVSFTGIFSGPNGITCAQAFCPRGEAVLGSVEAELKLFLEPGQGRE